MWKKLYELLWFGIYESNLGDPKLFRIEKQWSSINMQKNKEIELSGFNYDAIP